MNGKDVERIKNLDEKELKVYIALRLEEVQKNQEEHSKKIDCLDKKVGKIPNHCIQVERLEKMDVKLNCLEKKEISRKAVKALLFGGGGVGLVGLIVAILKFIFNIF